MNDREFSGTLRQCLDHLRGLPRENTHLLIKFTEAHENTVYQWLLDIGGKRNQQVLQPSGVNWIKTTCFFRLNGWKVAELESNDPLIVTMAELWAYGVMTPEAIREELGYKSKDNTGLQQLIYGKKPNGFMGAHSKLMKHIAAGHKAALAARRKELQDQFALVYGEDNGAVESTVTDEVTMLAHLLKDALPLALRVNSDDSSDADRERLRKLVGHADYTELAVTLSQMKSARTRNDARAGRLR